MENQPNVTIKLVLKSQDKVLIVRHKNGAYDFPGGRVEFYEMVSETLRRELKEELGYELKGDVRLFHVWNYISKDRERHSVMIYYKSFIDEVPELVSPEGLEIFWLSIGEMKKIISDHSFVDRLYSNLVEGESL
jgi:8-oxo-dGTP diphosphatase